MTIRMFLAGLAVAGLFLAAVGASGAGADQSTTAKAATQPAKFVNVRCPIEGGAIDPAKVPDNCIREYKGEKVAFCCSSCPPVWDKLTDAEKDAKLEKVKAK